MDGIVPFALRPFCLLLAATLTLGCHAQKPAVNASLATPAATGKPLPPELAHRVEVLLRQKANLPPGSTMNISGPTPSDVPGYGTLTITFTSDEKTSHPINFLLSNDGKTLAQFSKYDISANPRDLVSAEGRPARGGPASAPVLIVGFDDLECPYCARLHETIFPAINTRYGNQVRVVYRDFPIEQHPWAMRAAVDVNCLGEQSVQGYWNSVDYIHAHASEIGEGDDKAKEKTLPKANEQLDKLVRQQGEFQKVDMPKLNACIAKQDTKAVEASRNIGVGLGIDSTPTLFINGDKINGALPVEFIFGIVDDALRAAGQTPPPPYVAPAAAPAPAKATPGQ